jgi:DNA-binding CsgD family transcriptional regulator
MYLSGGEMRCMLEVVQALNGEEDFNVRRAKAGRALLELFQADFFGSFHWNESCRRFEDHVTLNMAEANLVRYDQYYQFHSPISMPMQRMARAVSVNQIMEQRDFERTEYYNDFLKLDGLRFGLNLHVYDRGCPIADWRIWRGRGRENFERRSLEVLDCLAPYLRNATRMALLLRACQSAPVTPISIPTIREKGGLSDREAQIAYHALLGKADREIAATLFLSLATVRTHLRHVYRKLGVHNRSSLHRRLAESNAPGTSDPVGSRPGDHH